MLTPDLLLVKILKIVIDYLPRIQLPVRLGRPYVYSPLVMVCCFLVMVAKQLSKRGLYVYLTRDDDLVAISIRETIPFPDEQIPTRRTFDRRLSACQETAQLYLLEGAKFLVKLIGLGLARLALDNRMFPAMGAIWHRKHQKLGIIPKGLRNVDRLAGWGVSAYRKWVFGHGLEVFVTTGKLVIPVLAFARSLTIKGNTAVKQFARLLTRIEVKKGLVVADSEYEDQVLATIVSLSGRNLITASKRHPQKVLKSRTYARRKVTVEPLYERFLLALSARGKLPFKGTQAWGWLIVALFLYQVAVIYQVVNHHPHPTQVTHLIHAL